MSAEGKMEVFNPNDASAADSGLYGLPRDLEDPRVIVIPVPWEATASYGRGTAAGPRAILNASRQVELFDLETKDPWQAGISMLAEAESLVAWNSEARALAEGIIAQAGRIGDDPDLAGALARVNALSEEVHAWVERETHSWLEKQRLVVIVGGEHSVSFGAISAVARRHPGVGVLQVDAHADLRVAFEGFEHSHASIMHNVAARLPAVSRIVQVAVRDLGSDEHAAIRDSGGRIVTFFDNELQAGRFRGETWSEQCDRIVAALPKEVYISFDIDGLDPAFCPSTGTPVPGGVAFAEATFLLGAVVRSGRRIVGCDLTEVAPGRDGQEWDANVGARLLYKLIGWMLQSH